MFERYTEKARRAVVLAQDEARGFNHNYIGTEHLLLGLIRVEDSVSAEVLASLDLTADEVRKLTDRFVGRGTDAPLTGQIPFTPRTKKVLELGLREALSLGHNYIATEHVLLGLVRENGGVAARILSTFDLSAERIRDAVLAHLRGEKPATSTKGSTVPEMGIQIVQERRAHVTITTIDGATITGTFVKWSDPCFMATGPQNQTTAWMGEDSDGALMYVPWSAIRMLRVTPMEPASA